MVVWDVASCAACAILEDALTAAHGRRADGVTRPGIAAVAWVTADPHLLGIAVASGTFLVWDTKRESRPAPAAQLADPCRHICTTHLNTMNVTTRLYYAYAPTPTARLCLCQRFTMWQCRLRSI